MKKNVLIFGLIAGAILSANMVIMVYNCSNNPDYTGNMVFGYATMLIILSLVFFGVRNYRNKELNGFISFGKALKVGVLIALVAGTMYVLSWLLYYYNFAPDFMDKYAAHILKTTPAAELPAKTKEMASMKEMYKNPLFVILMTYAEVLPVGLLVALLSALFLKKKDRGDLSVA